MHRWGIYSSETPPKSQEVLQKKAHKEQEEGRWAVKCCLLNMASLLDTKLITSVVTCEYLHKINPVKFQHG